MRTAGTSCGSMRMHEDVEQRVDVGGPERVPARPGEPAEVVDDLRYRPGRTTPGLGVDGAVEVAARPDFALPLVRYSDDFRQRI
ncbi:hypothetical protein ASE38_15505 [Cellulomonas sp. Root930]|nr:hypothetical protein ASE38_15505 [Cellulomonas sp. Root930]